MAVVINKKAKFEYSVEKKYTAGLVLSGQEVKSLRLKHGSLTGSYIKIIGGEAFLINAHINPYSFADTSEYDPKRTRKLLLTKKELLEIQEESQNQGRTIVPLAIFVQGRTLKLELAVAKGKKIHEKRAVIRARDQEREVARELKQRY